MLTRTLERNWHVVLVSQVLSCFWMALPSWAITEADLPDVIFATRRFGPDGHYYANFGYYCFDPQQKVYAQGGGSLRRLNPRTGEVVTLLEDPDGGTPSDPSPLYLREMQRYGILPAEFDPEVEPLDPYATDEAYWRSFWYQPAEFDLDFE